MNKSLLLKILAPVVLIVLIIGLFFIKNAFVQKEGADTEQISDTKELSDNKSDNKNDDKSEDNQNNEKKYPLKIYSVNLERIKQYGVPTVIDFGSDSCIPCKQMAPVLETLNDEWQGKAAVQFIDVWKYTDGVTDFPIQVIPTQVFFTAEGKPFVPSEELAAKIQFDMYSDKTTGEHIFTIHQGGIKESEMRLIFAEMGLE